MTSSTASRVLEALGGNGYWVRIYEGARKSGDTKTMAEIRKFLRSYAKSDNGSWAADILKRLEPLGKKSCLGTQKNEEDP